MILYAARVFAWLYYWKWRVAELAVLLGQSDDRRPVKEKKAGLAL